MVIGLQSLSAFYNVPGLNSASTPIENCLHVYFWCKLNVCDSFYYPLQKPFTRLQHSNKEFIGRVGKH